MTKARKTALDFLSGGGEMGELMRSFAWGKTPLGPPETWPQSLKTAVRIMLTSRQPIWIGWGRELTVLYNDPYQSIIGGKHPWALGRPTEVVWQEIWSEIRPMLDTAMTGIEGTYVEAQLLIMERHGYPEETYYTFSYSPIPDDDGSAGGIICANTDDTQRVTSERQLTLLRDLATAAADARTLDEACARSLRALALNPRDIPFALLYLGAPTSTVLSLAGHSGVPAGDAVAQTLRRDAGSRWPIAEVLDTHELRVVTDLTAIFSGPPPAGAWKQPPQQAALLPILPSVETGRAGILVIGLSPYRQRDRRYRDFLGLVAGQVTAAIAHAQAYEEERRRAEALAEIDRAKTIFFSNASHEFRTPLALMLSPLADLLVRHPMSEAVFTERRELELMHRNGLRLLKLVNTLLDFSRIEAGRVQAVYEPVDLATYTADLASTFRSAMEKAGLRFTVDCPALPFSVHVDRDMWEKIVLNLVSNAFKYTLDGEVAVTLQPAGDGRVMLRVRDSGVGIPTHELPRLFERFHRIEGQRGRTQEGTGIGLALVQELVRLHGGTVEAESTVGRGTIFTVSIPAGTAHLPADRVERPRDNLAASAGAFVVEALRWLPGESAAAESAIDKELLGPAPAVGFAAARSRVVLADDNADMRDYVRRLLAERYDVEAVGDGEAALAAARRQRPDLVLSDVMMPRLDGVGLVKALRGDAELRDVPIVLLSARAGEEARVEGLEIGADDYLVKPFSARELIARIDTNMAMARLRREAAEVLYEETRRLRALHRTGAALTAELDLERLVQTVTDNAVELTGAAFGAFFYNVTDKDGEAYTLYTLSGAPREAFAQFPMPRNTAIFEPTFRGAGVVRSDDIHADPRYGQNAPYHGMPPGHLPVRSYLAVPVISRTGEVLGGLFFGHSEAGIFSERAELIVSGIAAQAAVAIDNARLYRASQEAQTALRALNETLEQRVEERAREVHLTLAQLRESERRMRLIVESVVDYAIFMLDPQGLISSWNPGAQRIKGYRPDEIIGQHFSRFYPEEDRRDGLPDRALRTATTTGKFEHEGWRVRKDGTRFWASVIIDAIRDDDGTLLGFVKVTRDLTERRSIEEQLRQAQKMEAIGQLTGGVAHDFNNLLQVVLANLDALRRRAPEIADATLGVDVRRFVEGALRGAERAATLTQRLLAFSRRQPLLPKPTDVNKLVAGMSELLRRTLGETIAIETVTAGGLWRVSVDPNQLESALLNLAVNARDAMPGGGKLTLETANTYLDEAYAASHDEVAAGQYAMIAVTDTGAGMTRQVLEHVFEPFFTTKEVGHGTGLGLSQVYGFVKQSGGHVKIYSEIGEGTTVKLYLPRLRGGVEADEPLHEATILKGRRSDVVLLVEDDDDVRATTSEMLRELGYAVVPARDGASALRLLETRPDIRMLFTDVGLPEGMNGRQLADAARARRPTLPVLFTTGYARNAIVHHGRLDPGIHLLVKPFTYAALAAKLRAILG